MWKKFARRVDKSSEGDTVISARSDSSSTQAKSAISNLADEFQKPITKRQYIIF